MLGGVRRRWFASPSYWLLNCCFWKDANDRLLVVIALLVCGRCDGAE